MLGFPVGCRNASCGVWFAVCQCSGLILRFPVVVWCLVLVVLVLLLIWIGCTRFRTTLMLCVGVGVGVGLLFGWFSLASVFWMLLVTFVFGFGLDWWVVVVGFPGGLFLGLYGVGLWMYRWFWGALGWFGCSGFLLGVVDLGSVVGSAGLGWLS